MDSKTNSISKPVWQKSRSVNLNSSEDMVAPMRRMSMDLETKVDQLKSEVVTKIDREMTDSQNARDFIAQKYNELCDKIKTLAELDSTVSSFRGEVHNLERVIHQLMLRIEDLEKRNRTSNAGLPADGPRLKSFAEESIVSQ